MVVACCGARVHCTSSMSTWFGGITWLSWRPWMRKQPSGGETAALKSVGTTVLRSSGSKYGQIPMERTLWRFRIGSCSVEVSHTPVHWQKISPGHWSIAKKTQLSNYRQVQTFVMATDQELTPTRLPYQYSSFAVQLWVSISAWTPNVMTWHDHLQKNTGMPRPMEACCFSIYFCPVFFPQLLLKFSCRRLAGTQHCAVNFSLWA
jgi:hypothetical protein